MYDEIHKVSQNFYFIAFQNFTEALRPATVRMQNVQNTLTVNRQNVNRAVDWQIGAWNGKERYNTRPDSQICSVTGHC